MREVTMFEAEDGTLFRNESDCITHDQLGWMTEIEGQVQCWNYDGVDMSAEDIVAHPADIYYIDAKTERAMEAICDILSESTCFHDVPPSEPGRYFISDISEDWISLNELEEEYFNASKVFRG